MNKLQEFLIALGVEARHLLNLLPRIFVEMLLVAFFLLETLGKALLLLALINMGAAVARIVCTYGLGSQPGLLAAMLVQYGGILYVVFRVREGSFLLNLRKFLRRKSS